MTGGRLCQRAAVVEALRCEEDCTLCVRSRTACMFSASTEGLASM